MAYEKGDAEIVTPDEDQLEYGGLYDNRRDDGWKVPVVQLPHSCDAWVIGGRKEVEQMIADLTELLPQLPE